MTTVRNHETEARFETLRHEVTEAGRTLWLAGLGAARRAEEEGRGLFDTLVERGRKVEKRQFKAIDRRLAETGRRVSDLSGRVQVRFEDRVRATLNRLGVASREDVRGLAGRLEALDRKVARIAAETVAAEKVAAERHPAAPAA
jgi:poly(hydroxyalkanoate) granule-associated protein